MPKTLYSILRVLVHLYAAWLAMMLIHEAGHVLGALATGGHVVRVVWGPFTLSRTDVDPNPHANFVTWAGPLFGAIAPTLLAGVLRKSRFGNPLAFLAGFCLIANGEYLSVGAFSPAGDARDLLHMGTPRWLLVAVGTPMCVLGLWLWHCVTVKPANR